MVSPYNNPMDNDECLWMGLDIGSTTVKAVVINPLDSSVLFTRYVRHGARQADTAAALCSEISVQFPLHKIKLALCGSGGKEIADAIGAGFIQEVVANSLAVRHSYPATRTAIELGGQDAKIVFFHYNESEGRLDASDMRMNGACAGGTGAFIDEVASILHVPVEEFNAYAAGGSHVFDISGRCGVFAKTDIQPLLNQGVGKEDIALSTFHAIAKQTIGGLSQGLEIHAPVTFVGGPLNFNPVLVRVFAERLGLGDGGVIVPDDPRTLVAFGAALSIGSFLNPGEQEIDFAAVPELIYRMKESRAAERSTMPLRFFDAEADKAVFMKRHGFTAPRVDRQDFAQADDKATDIYIGIDGGSTTSKCVALSADDEVLGTWYANNQGNPIEVMVKLLLDMETSFLREGRKVCIRGVGSTGYAEMLFSKAFSTDYHNVETVAHAHAALHFVPGTSFVLDIGGQDMKAIQIHDDIVTGIVLNEACSAGCGSFLENFARSLDIPVQEIASRAFASENPSVLGSRCTVFMNSSIISEQKNGKGPEDIMAGLCRSIIENIFTKVVRISNFDALGAKVVVQGGTFKNEAVLRAMEQYIGRDVIRAPYPGEMGAIGIALLVKKHFRMEPDRLSSFIGFDSLRNFTYTQKNRLVCPLCTNNCLRTVIEFPNGKTHVSGNRCDRGEIVLPPKEAAIALRTRKTERVPNLFRERHDLLLADWPINLVDSPKEIRIGIPMALEFLNSIPFWRGFFGALGFKVIISSPSSQSLFEAGLKNIPSDTVCFPAKLVHGHVLDLINRKVDRIFMPMLNRMIPENSGTKGNHVCAVVKGYPLVVHYSDEPENRHGIPFDHPMFHWFDVNSRNRQLCDWIQQLFGISFASTLLAIEEADSAQAAFCVALARRGGEVLAELEAAHAKAKASGAPLPFAVILAGRPYHGDFLVNHDLDRMIQNMGIPILPLDALPGLNRVDLSRMRAEITTPFHTRMYAAADLAARNPFLELVQIVSFGCGHDAIISDEISSLMKNVGGKTPLILKLDESDVRGPLSIRVRSFVETVRSRRETHVPLIGAVPDPFMVKFTKKAKKEKTILIPNVTVAFSKMLESAMSSEGYRVAVLPMADRAAIALGKQFVHNDICYPAQVNIGEILGALRSGAYNPDEVVCGLAKSQCDCRLAHYAALARRALDDAGYSQMPIITTDEDNKGMHPAFKSGMRFQVRAVWGLNMADVLEHVRRRLRPYELIPGQTEEIFQESVAEISAGLKKSVKAALRAFDAAVDKFASMPANLASRKPRVFLIGEFLLNFHPGSNNNMELYLEKNGLEVVLPDAFTPMHRDFLKKESEARLFFVKYPFLDMFANNVTLKLIDHVKKTIKRKAGRMPFFQAQIGLRELAAISDPVVHHTFTPGEGWLIAAEILHNADLGIESFVIVQPFGCMPNHVVGRGLMKVIRKMRPGIRILALDFDPDTSFANIENRLQMLIINTKEAHARLQLDNSRKTGKDHGAPWRNA